MATGVRGDAESGVRAGIRHILFSVRPEEEAKAMDTYLKALTPVPSPFLEQGRLSASAKRGKGLFKLAGCATCHVPPLYTDLQSYDVGLGRMRDRGRAFDTPTLVEVWRTAPYLYDGRTETLLKMLTEHNAQNRHGHTQELSREDLVDLAHFVLSL
jgi:cytochrome c peroxidase